MIRTGNRYLDSIRDGREVYINGGRVEDVTDTVLEAIGGVVTRVGDETVGEMWSAPYANQAFGRAPSYGVPGDL